MTLFNKTELYIFRSHTFKTFIKEYRAYSILVKCTKNRLGAFLIIPKSKVLKQNLNQEKLNKTKYFLTKKYSF